MEQKRPKRKLKSEKRFLAQLECGIFEKQLAFTFAQFKVRFSWAQRIYSHVRMKMDNDDEF